MEFENYVVKSKKKEVPGVYTITLVKEDKTVLDYKAGQYINVYVSETDISTGRAYSISSAPGKSEFDITVRKTGRVSGQLCAVKEGDALKGSLPCGFFFPEKADSSLVLIASGIGVAPFRSMLFDIASTCPHRKILLFHSIRNLDDKIFANDLMFLQKQLPNFSYVHFVTREKVKESLYQIPRRMTADDISQNKQVKKMLNPEFLICGSVPFVRDMWKALHASGVSEDYIYTEAFFS